MHWSALCHTAGRCVSIRRNALNEHSPQAADAGNSKSWRYRITSNISHAPPTFFFFFSRTSMMLSTVTVHFREKRRQEHKLC